MKQELRIYANVEIRAVESDNARRLTGRAIPFNSESVDLGGFIEVVKPGSPKFRADGVMAFWNHESGSVLGRTSSGTLKLAQDDQGVHFDVLLPDTTVGRDAFVSVGRGDVTGMSFGFNTIRDTWAKRADGMALRYLEEIEVMEISVVTFPAYPQTDVAVRAFEEWRKQNEKPWAPSTEQLRRRLSLSELEN